MKTYIFTDQELFKRIYENLFAMRVFHRTDEQGRLLVKFATKSFEKQILNSELKNQFNELKQE